MLAGSVGGRFHALEGGHEGVAGDFPTPADFVVGGIDLTLEGTLAGKAKSGQVRTVVKHGERERFHAKIAAIELAAELAGGGLHDPDANVNGKEGPVPGAQSRGPNPLQVGAGAERTVGFGEAIWQGLEYPAGHLRTPPMWVSGIADD